MRKRQVKRIKREQIDRQEIRRKFKARGRTGKIGSSGDKSKTKISNTPSRKHVTP